jgi:hypothetical protein
MAPRTRRKIEAGDTDRLAVRVAELELRIRMLEARIREVAPTPKKGKAKAQRLGRPRPRCPGCLLELPKGRRGESCVWCGFFFDAVEKRAFWR